MNLVNPLFLLGLLAAGVPVLIHLIRRAHARRVEFPSLMFLRRVSRKHIRFQKLRHILLLLLRVLMFVFLALAFSRPYRDLPHAAAAPGQETTAHIILLDNSLSMGYGDRWQRAKAGAAEIAREARPGDSLALIEFSDQATVLVPLGTDRALALSQIENGAKLTDRPTRYAQALRTAESLAADARAGRRLVHVVSDFQKTGVAAEEQDFRLGGGVELAAVDVGAGDWSNLTVVDARLLERDPGSISGIRGSVLNLGAADRNGTRITLWLEGREIGRKVIDASKGSVQDVDFPLPALGPGPHEIALQVEDPNLTRDNRFCLRLDSLGRRPVLSVDGAGRGGRSASVFLAAALNASASSPFQLSVRSFRQFESAAEIPGRLLIWNNVAAGSDRVQEKLRSFVAGGGGLVVAVSDAVPDQEFNRGFGAWLPVRKDPAVKEPGSRLRPRDEYLLLTDVRLDHPVFTPFREPHSGTFATARFYRHARLSTAAGAEVLARFDNGDPALVSAAVGEGRVLVFASTADDLDNDLPLRAVYAPFWHQLLRSLEGFREQSLWYRVGDIVAPRKLLAEAARNAGAGRLDAGQALAVMDPEKQRVPTDQSSDSLVLGRAGVYQFRSSLASTGVAVNPQPRESDLGRADPDALVAAWTSAGASAGGPAGEEAVRSPESQDRQQRLWRYLLLAAAALFLGEGLLANRLVLRDE